MDGVELSFTDDAFAEIAKLAIERKTGARGLRGILEGILGDLMFTIPSSPDVKKVTITGKVVRGEAKPKLLMRRGSKELPESVS